MNPGQVGFYRVCYTKEMVEKLVPAIKDISLPPLDRLGVENDQFALVGIRELKILRRELGDAVIEKMY